MLHDALIQEKPEQSMYAVQCKLDCPHGMNAVPFGKDWQANLLRLPLLCRDCQNDNENWICLTCHSVFCSRYVNGHAVDHFETTNHNLAISLSDLSVWCYSCAEYVKIPEIKPAHDAVYFRKFGEKPPEICWAVNHSENASIECSSVSSVRMEPATIHNTVFIESENKYSSRDEELLPVVIYWNAKCRLHKIEGHPERPERVDVILQRLRKEWPPICFRECTPITKWDILRFHTKAAADVLYGLADIVGDSDKVAGIDGDTAVMRYTLDAALHAAGSLINAVDALYDPSGRQFRSAFCCVRPPGHHAERNKSMGFCFLSNAGIAAKYAQQVYQVERVAVLDFDVHHGNGTEDGFRSDPTLFYGSTHEKDNYPGTGAEPRMKGELALREVDRRIVNRYLTAGKASKQQFHIKWQEVVDEMILFKPNLVIISAGFDAHSADQLGNCYLDDEDFEWATDIIVTACASINSSDPPPILSVLEGGYDLEAIAASASAHVKALSRGTVSPTTKRDDSVDAIEQSVMSLRIS